MTIKLKIISVLLLYIISLTVFSSSLAFGHGFDSGAEEDVLPMYPVNPNDGGIIFEDWLPLSSSIDPPSPYEAIEEENPLVYYDGYYDSHCKILFDEDAELEDPLTTIYDNPLPSIGPPFMF